MTAHDFFVALRPRKRDGLLGTGTEREEDERVKARPRIPPEKTGETVDRRQNNGRVKVVSPRHCAATSALRNYCFNCRAGHSQKDNVRCIAVEEQLEVKEVQLSFAAQLHLPTHYLFWANLKVQLHLPPLRSLIF